MTLKLFVCPGCGTKITVEDDQVRVGGHTFHRDCAQSTRSAARRPRQSRPRRFPAACYHRPPQPSASLLSVQHRPRRRMLVTTPEDTHPAADVLAGLDFAAAPTCECKGCNVDHGDPCSAPAAWFLRVHLFGGCKHPVVFQTGGMVTQYACQACYEKRAASVERLRAHAERAHNVFGRPLICGTCDTPVTDESLWQPVKL